MDRFSAFLPFSVELLSAADSLDKSKESPKVAKIRGIISSENVDQQGDILLQDGLDFSYFLSRGFLNDDHKPGAGNILGEPVSITRTLVNGKPATMMEGNLYLNKPQARAVYESACAMKAAGSTRSLGFSVEGQVLERDPSDKHIVKKARILHVAITNAPVNLDAANMEVLARSLGSEADYASQVNGSAASAILEMHPELRKPGMLAALSSLINGGQEDSKSYAASSMATDYEKSSIGYQTPAQPSASDALSPLVPSSLSTMTSDAAGLPKKKKNKMMMGGDPSSVASPVASPMMLGGDPSAVASPSTMASPVMKDSTVTAEPYYNVKKELVAAALSVLQQNYIKNASADFTRFSNAVIASMHSESHTDYAASAATSDAAASDAAADAEYEDKSYYNMSHEDKSYSNMSHEDKSYYNADAPSSQKKITATALSHALKNSFPNLSVNQVKKLASSLVFAARNRL